MSGRALLANSTLRSATWIVATRAAHAERRVCYYSTTFDDVSAVLRTHDVPVASRRGYIRVLELNRPEARNALSVELVSALQAAIRRLHGQYHPRTGQELPMTGSDGAPTRALIIASTSSVFCAGADLKERQKFSPEETSSFLTMLRSTLQSLADLPVPTISAIAGPALGGGLELALATHFRVLAHPTAVVGLPETRLAIIPGAGGTYRLPELIGVPRARDLILTGRRVDAREAKEIHLADRVVDIGDDDYNSAPQKVMNEAVSLAQEICAGGPVAIRAALKAVMNPRRGPAVEGEMYLNVLNTEDRNEALIAFSEKRKPVFKGK